MSIYHGTCGGTQYTKTSNAWIDFVNSGTFEASEQVGTAMTSNFGVAMVLREGGPPAACGTFTWGETKDFTVAINNPVTGLSSDFFVPNNAYVGTAASFINSNQTGYISHVWTIDGTTYNSTNATHVFSTAGTFDVKSVSENCLGVDSTSKTVTIITPTAPPVADFVSDKNVVEIFESVQLIDLSTNGATFWSWFLTNGTDTIDFNDQPDLSGNDPLVNQNPTVLTGNYIGAVDVGTWTVCLKSSNVIGSSATVCKMGYITVQRTSFDMGPSTSLPANIITATSGELFDKGGALNNYTTPESNLEALIAPCGAQSVTLDFSVFELLSNATLQIYDGVNALGTPLHTGSGFTDGNEPSGPIVASSGAMYLLWNSTAGGTDDGFAATWTSVAGAGVAPVASFSSSATDFYNLVNYDFMNTSTDAEGNTSFEWTVTDPTGAAVTTSNRDLLNQIFTTNGTYTVELKVTGCDGTVSTSSQSINVLAPNTPTSVDFTVTNQRPSLGETVTFTAITDKANTWEWQFFPPVNIDVAGADTDMERDVTFNAPGTYAVQLRAYNTADEAGSEATVVKTAYVIVVEHCTPIIGVTTSTDVGISYVSLEDPITSDLFENSSAAGDSYTDYSSLGAVELNFGGTYNFEVRRSSNVNPMNRKVWIDWNVDGDFDDAGELIATEATGNTMSWTGAINVPDASGAFEANTLMRVGVSFNNDLNLPCGASDNPAANRIGEFEDYAVRVVNDGDKPVITLNGADTVFIEQKPVPDYVSLGATATDPSQGDVTANVTMGTDVDQTLAGIYFETYNAMDASGNAADEVTRVVFVVSDQTAPVITLIGAADETVEVGTVWTDLGATAIDNKEGNITAAIVTSGSVDHTELGVYTITYSIQDNQGNASSVDRIVRVVDTQVPTIDNASADKSGACWTVEVQLQSIFVDITLASDNHNSLGDGLTFTANPASPQGGAAVDTRFQGTTSVTYTATDVSGNVTTQCVDYIVKDFIAPVIDLRTLDVINHPVNMPYTPVAATATDNLFDASQISLTSTSNVNAFVLGTYQDTYTATDAAGNISTVVRTVNVVDEVAPVITGKTGGILKVGVGSSVDAITHINFSDNYDGRDVLLANAELIFNNINMQEAGIYSAIFTTADASGNVSDEFRLIVEVSHDFAVKTNSVDELALEELMNVYPNPTSGNVNITVDLPENEDISVSVYNAMGKQVYLVTNGKVSNGSYSVDLSNEVDGIYFVRMSVNGAIVTKKLVLNK